MSPITDSPVPALRRRLAPVLLLAMVYVVVGAVLRMVLGVHALRAGELPVTGLPGAALAGLANDAVVALAFVTPFALWQLLPSASRDPRRRRLYAVALTGLVFAWLYFAVAEYFFFEEFDARFNIVAFDYLMYPTEVIGDLRAEYPMGRVGIAAVLLAITVVFALRERWFAVRPTLPAATRWIAGFAWLGMTFVALAAWRTDALSVSPNRAWNEVAQNGVSGFFRAARTSEIEYRDFYLVGDQEKNRQLLARELTRDGSRLVDRGDGSLLRQFPGRADGLGRLNVVVVASESFGAEFSRLYGATQDLTPEFDRLAQRGLWFSRTYASGTRTVRGLEALSASFPPIPTVSILRRPNHDGIATWGAVMRELGYGTSFLYGGYGYFDNMNAFFADNGYDVVDRRDIAAPRFANVWGVSDEDLFDRALTYYDDRAREGRPFFSIVMTTSNHKPFTFRPGLESVGVPPTGGGRAAGVRYADHALGYFLREAARHDWFRDTVFVVVADHGARVYGRAEIPLRTYEIPLMVYSPAHVAPRRVDTLMTQIDVAPTVLGLLGLPYAAPFFGIDVLAAPATRRVALFNHNHDVALYRDGDLAILGLNRTVTYVRHDPATGRDSPIAPDAELRDLAVAYFQTASELFHDRRYRPAGKALPRDTAVAVGTSAVPAIGPTTSAGLLR